MDLTLQELYLFLLTSLLAPYRTSSKGLPLFYPTRNSPRAEVNYLGVICLKNLKGNGVVEPPGAKYNGWDKQKPKKKNRQKGWGVKMYWEIRALKRSHISWITRMLENTQKRYEKAPSTHFLLN